MWFRYYYVAYAFVVCASSRRLNRKAFNTIRIIKNISQVRILSEANRILEFSNGHYHRTTYI